MEPVPNNEAATSRHELKQIQLDLAELRKLLGNEWETADEVFKNITYFKDWLPRTQWAYRDRTQTYLLFNTQPTNLKKQLVKVDWTRHCAAKDAAKGSLKTMQNWILSWRHVRPRAETALCALYTRELKQGPKEQLRTWYEKIQKVGEDAYGRNKHMWTLPQRRIVARAFISGCRYHKAHWHLQQDTLEGMDERLINVHLNHCRNVFEESRGCENQHPYVTLQWEAERRTTNTTASATVWTNNSSNRMSVDPSRNSSNRMSVQAVNPAREEPYNPQCYHCGDYGHIIRSCPTRPPRPRGAPGPPARQEASSPETRADPRGGPPKASTAGDRRPRAAMAALLPLERAESSRLHHARVHGLQQHQQHREQRPPQPRSGTR